MKRKSNALDRKCDDPVRSSSPNTAESETAKRRRLACDDLPPEIVDAILGVLDIFDLLSARRVYRQWRGLITARLRYHTEALPDQRAFVREMAARGDLDAVQRSWPPEVDQKWQERFLVAAVGGGHLALARWLAEEKGCYVSAAVCVRAAASGRIDMIEWVNGDRPEPVIYEMCDTMAENGHLDALRWYHARGYKCGDFTCAYAAKGGHLDVLKWLRSIGCEWTWHVCDWAAAHGHAHVVWWAAENGCEWGDVCTGFAGSGLFDDLREAHRREDRSMTNATCDAAAAAGRIDIIEWTLAQGCTLRANTCRFAIENGHVAVLDWLRAHDCPWHHAMWFCAIVNNHLSVLVWAAAHDYRPSKHDGNVCDEAARRGRLSILEWLVVKQGLPIGPTTCKAAAEGGRLDVLEWLCARDCPWDERTCERAATGNHVATLAWAIEAGCPYSAARCRKRAERYNSFEIIKWLDARPCL
ncbi:F-box domain containing protein [Pandoravirus neocaledonia]|uniref:F-box domain containing protein n=1 Tax=Pandoravirus neocaledonia TaxID=2107708 RepID=A0A2U7UE50_9VIRU|nr:F-box domain containing protein [Pandoravirus neocaledonia]AVK76635.1 F-box domain containing protein [Pandoravirus neocaledonia]